MDTANASTKFFTIPKDGMEELVKCHFVDQWVIIDYKKKVTTLILIFL